MRKWALVLALLAAGLLFGQFVRLTPTTPTANHRRSEKIDLALRRTAHRLLVNAGDSSSRIAPVRQLNATTFRVRLDHSFSYDRLPALLQQSLDIHEIKGDYDVAVLDCATGDLQLGYNFRDVTGQKGVPCGGRDQQQGCYNLQLTFAEPVEQPARVWWPWAVGFLLLGGAYVVWQQSHRKPNPVRLPAIATHESEPLLWVGQSAFNLTNQAVSVGGVAHPLTYREAKLLHLFLRHPNQLLERGFILKSVWEDEGIFVGRSVDVFVSRLRKLLHADPSLRLVAVHGVGYRLEVIT